MALFMNIFIVQLSLFLPWYPKSLNKSDMHYKNDDSEIQTE